MINKYLNYLQEDDENLNEFIVLPAILLSMHLYKKYTEHKKIAQYCITTQPGSERRRCFINYRIQALEKTLIEIKKLKPKCKLATDLKKCVDRIDKEINKLVKEISKLKRKLSSI